LANIGDFVKVSLRWPRPMEGGVETERVWAQIVGVESDHLKVRLDNGPLCKLWQYNDVIVVQFIERSEDMLMLAPVHAPASSKRRTL
jgi:hypothetical protein